MSENIKSESVMDSFRSKVGSVNALRSIFTRSRIQAGQKVIDDVKETYFDNIDELIAVFQAASAGNGKPKEIYEATKSLKAQAEGLGFIFLMELGNGLYKFLQDKIVAYSTSQTELDKDDMVVVKSHAAAIMTALKNRERGKGGIVEADILNSLELLRNRYAKQSS